jgi:hypothetical protein
MCFNAPKYSTAASYCSASGKAVELGASAVEDPGEDDDSAFVAGAAAGDDDASFVVVGTVTSRT